MIEENSSNQSEQCSEQPANTDLGSTQIPSVQDIGSNPANPPADRKPKQPKKIIVEVIRDEELKPFEEETLKIARDARDIANNQTRLTVWAVVVAAIAGMLVLGQIQESTWNNQILAAQTESAIQSASESSIATRKQLEMTDKQIQIAQRQIALSEKVFEASERPYIGVDQISMSGDSTKNKINFVATIKNFGSNPAEWVTIERHWYWNGTEMIRMDKPLKRNKGIFFPGSTRNLGDVFSNVDFKGLDSDTHHWTVKISSTYRWSTKHYRYCEQWEYAPAAQTFETLGSCLENPK
jgi:hypothetical protein